MSERSPDPAAPCDLLVVAELNPDVVVATGTVEVRFGQVEQVVPEAALTLGSSGAITASAAAALGLRVRLVAAVGDDAAGELAVSLLAAQGVDVSAVVRRPDVATGMTIALARPDGDRAVLTSVGAMAALSAAQVPRHLIEGARHVHVSSLFLQRGLRAGVTGLLATARAAGATTSLDTGWDPDERWVLPDRLLAHVDHLLPNAAEARHLAAALSGQPQEDLVAAARVLRRHGPTVAVKCGADGALLVGATALRATAPRSAVVDTTGAGDNFDAGYLSAVIEGGTAAEALARAVACGSVSVRGRGGTGSHASRRLAAEVARDVRITPVPAETDAAANVHAGGIQA